MLPAISQFSLIETQKKLLNVRDFSICTGTTGAGVAHTKLLAKLCSGLNKPNKQTVVPQSSVAGLLRDLPLERLRGLGGGLGQRVRAALRVHTVGAPPRSTSRYP